MSRTTTYTTPEGRHTRDAIIDAATKAFAVRGYRSTSIDSIATWRGCRSSPSGRG